MTFGWRGEEMNGMPSKYVYGIVMMLAVAGATGCDDMLGPDNQAEMEAAVDGADNDESEGGPAQGENPMATASEEEQQDLEQSVTGTVDVRAKVMVQAATGEWREVTRGYAEQRVRIDGSDGLKLLGSSELEAGQYVRVRVEFEKVDADVTSGLWIGLYSLTGQVAVDAGSDNQIVIEREISFTAEARTRTRIRIGLSAEEWLRRASTSTMVVSEADFRSAVEVGVQ
jgi:hypothetical protein